MKELIKFWKYAYFTELILLVLLIILLIVSYRKRKLYYSLLFLPYYLLFFILLLLNNYIQTIFFNSNSFTALFNRIEAIGDLLVTTIEFITFSYFLYTILRSKKFKAIIKIAGTATIPVFLLLFFFSWYFNYNLRNDLSVSYIIESSTLLLFCSLYFIELFTLPPVDQLIKSPDFWISTGLMFYLIGTFPLTIIAEYIITTNYLLYNNLFTIIYVFYIILFLFIIKAYSLATANKLQQQP